MEFNQDEKTQTPIHVNGQDASSLKSLAFSRVRASIKFFSGDQELLQNELVAALTLFDQTEKGIYKVELVVTKDQFNNIQDGINNFHAANELLLLFQGKYNSTLLNNRGDLSDEEQMEEVRNIELEITDTSRTLDRIIRENKKK